MSTFTTAGWEDKKEVSEGIAFPPYGVTDTNPDPLRILHITSSGVEECGVPSHLDLEDNTILCAGDFESKTCQLSGGLPLMEVCFKLLFLI